MYYQRYDPHSQKYDPSSQMNIMKSLRDRRTGNLNDPGNIFGDNCQELTCKWRGVKDLNKENDNYNSPIDHSRDSELGIIQTKGAKLSTARQGLLEYERWSRAVIREHTKEFDYLIFYCASKDGEMIERIYIFPRFEITCRTFIGIYKNVVNGWYEKYRVRDKEILEQVNKIWKKIIGKG